MSRWHRFLHRDRLDAEQREELDHYLHLTAEEYAARGLDPQSARLAARRKLGNPGSIQEEVYRANTIDLIDDLLRDARCALRLLRTQPAFSLTAVLTLALGIGATTAIFAVAYGVLLRPLPYPDPAALVSVRAAGVMQGEKIELELSPALFRWIEAGAGDAFEHFGVWSAGSAALNGRAAAEQVATVTVTQGVLPALGVAPHLGRLFSAADDSPGTPETVLLMHAYWKTRLGAKVDVIGQTLEIDGVPRRIIGILPAGFRFLNLDPAVILPQRFAASGLRPDFFNHPGLARLRSGVSLEQANHAAAAGIRSGGAAAGAQRMLRMLQIAPDVHPLQRDIVGDAGPVLWLLFGAVGIGLLLACANVANLFLTRMQARRQEFAIRAALGAGWGRIARELLVEGLLVGLLAGALGVGIAGTGIQVLVAYGPAELPRLREISVDGNVAGFAFACSLGCSLFLALIPMVRCARPAQFQQQRGSTRSADQRRTQDALVVSQVALALVLLIASGLMIRTCLSLLAVDPGFAEPQSVQTFRLSIPEAHASAPTRLQESILQRLAAIPGVSAVGFTNAAPLDLDHQGSVVIAVEGRTADGQMPPARFVKAVSPGYLAAQGTPLLAGRDFAWSDVFPPRSVALVSASMARLNWGPDLRHALGRGIRVGRDGPLTEVVGIVSEVRELGVDKPAPPVVYLPATDLRAATFALRSPRAGTAPFLEEIVRTVQAVHPGLPVAQVQTLGETYRRSLARPAFTLVLLGLAGSLSLALSLVGVYGLLAYSAAQRRQEIGIRMALGATPGLVAALFFRRGLLLTLAGIGAGLILALLLSRWMETLLFGVAPHDPLTYAAAVALLLLASLGACTIPALRAGQADPLEFLRAV